MSGFARIRSESLLESGTVLLRFHLETISKLQLLSVQDLRL